MTSECFYPDGITPTPSDGDYFLCTPSASHSACCKSGDACSTSGLCHGSSGYMYRGACTDSTWQAGQCAQHCQNASIHNYSHLYPCPSINGTLTHAFCCDTQDGSDDTSAGGCCANTFTEVDFGDILNRTSAQTSSSSSSSTTTSSPTTSVAANLSAVTSAPLQPTTSPHPSSSTKAAAIGAGIGVPLGVLLLAAFAYLWYRERVGRRQLERKLSAMQSLSGSSKVPLGYERGAQIHELDHVQKQAELHSQPRVEVADTVI